MQERRAISTALLMSILISFAWLGTASGAPTRDASDNAREIAQKVYAKAVDHYRAGRLLEALAAFRASYDVVASPNSHLMIARTMRDHGDIVEAYIEYGKLIVEAEAAAERDTRYAATAQASRAERAKLRARLTIVTVQVKEPPDDLRITIGDRSLDKDNWGTPVPIASGALVARANASGFPEQRRDLVAIPGGDLAVSFDFAADLRMRGPLVAESVPEGMPHGVSPFRSSDATPDIPRQPPRPLRPQPDRTWAYVSFGVGAAGLATFITAGAINQSIFNKLHDQCPGGHCSPSQAADLDKGRSAQVIANVGFGVALAGATLGCVLLVNAAGQQRTEEMARRPSHVALTDLSVGPHGVEVGGVF